jgi:uncharacterized protein with HEPN domain
LTHVKSPRLALADIVEAIERIRAKTEGLSQAAFEADWERRWIVERGAEIVSEASRRLSTDLKDRHPEIPWKRIAGIGNVLRHDYDVVSPMRLWNVARGDLAPLEAVCRAELARDPVEPSASAPGAA